MISSTKSGVPETYSSSFWHSTKCRTLRLLSWIRLTEAAMLGLVELNSHCSEPMPERNSVRSRSLSPSSSCFFLSLLTGFHSRPLMKSRWSM